MRSPAQIQRFLDNREKVMLDFFAGKDRAETKARVEQAEAKERQAIYEESGLINGYDVRDRKTASLKKLPGKIADRIRSAKKAAKAEYKPTAKQQAEIDLAKRLHMPILVHSRDAAADTLDLIKTENARDAGGVLHCFSYEPEMAKIYTDMGFYIGIGGVVTFKNARKLKEVAVQMPMELMLLETDCPYLAPEPFRGRRNDSSLIKYVAETIASLRGMSAEDVIRITAENARRFYGLQKEVK